MKKSIAILTICVLTMLSLTPSLSAQTTQEEYNYITKGYKIQLESGLDMKKGYSFTNMGEWSLQVGTEIRKCEFKGLIKQGKTIPCAIMMIYKRTDIPDGAIFYICIPSPDASKELWQQTLSFINTNFGKDSITMMNTIIWSLMKFSSKEVAK